MKRFFVAVLLIFLCFACSCTKEPAPKPSYTADQSESPAGSPFDTAELFSDYLKNNKVEMYWQDTLVSNNYLLYTGDCLVQLQIFRDLTRENAVPLSSVDRYTVTSLSDYSVLTVYNRSGECFSITLSVSDAEAVTDILG